MGRASLQPLRTHTKLVIRRLTATPLDLILMPFALFRRHFLETFFRPNQYHEVSGSQNTLTAVHRAKRPGPAGFCLDRFSFRGNPICSPYFLFYDVTILVDSPVTVDVNERPLARRNQPDAPLVLPYFCLSVATRFNSVLSHSSPNWQRPQICTCFSRNEPRRLEAAGTRRRATFC